MKKIIYAGLILLVGMSSCKKYLSQVPDDVLTEDKIFNTRNNTDNFLANIYNSIPNELQQRFTGSENSGPWIAASDEAKYTWDFNYANNMISGTWRSDDGSVAVFWANYYRAIRNATYFIQHIEDANPLELDQTVKTRYKAEARALRALYYFWLLRTYGPVPIIGEEVLDVNAPIETLRLPRAPFDQGIDYVVSQLDTAYKYLPVNPTSSQWGRMTKGMCKAYKVEALLYKASPLYNGNTEYAALRNADGTQLISQTTDVTKWAATATAAKEFIDEFVPTTYSLYTVSNSDPFTAAYLACRNVVTTDWNSEWIFARSNSGSYSQYDRTPKHVGSPETNGGFQGAGSLGVTQTMVDAYFTANGRSIDDPASGYVSTGFTSYQAPMDDVSRSIYSQWANREPRFYVGVTYNNSAWLNRLGDNAALITNFFYNGNSGRVHSISDVSPTGYCVRKNVTNGDGARGMVLLRLANIYLDYVEALNESDPGNADILTYLNMIRQRAGVPQYGSTDLPAPAGQAAMREAIRKERRVELAFESVRFFDTRRWKIAETTDGGPFYGMDMSKNDNTFYNRVLIETRSFRRDRDYLFPIPNSEMLNNNNLVQNPGW
ncbi:RagB/SusD family nutrient uptake outer membrane protein [Mucilaginibacter sp. JRF]|uniref:RagB/SusD family nutrient uptake outer membrane protein n=1 Tax=Mucilaginibacter sp. JRF TaxID=2780088 RepID=UPI001881B747|nr:RagB/SusD family nutrient uptake outer membrane protein [Mucilaginibacter sp. JRF]MBE9583996.1 RagB/SusD family nutrient uptake outer membrane protein [Mucilaginibacter sp. JRF]